MNHRDDRHGFVEVRLSLLPPGEGGRATAVRTGYMPNWWLPGDPDPVLASGAIELVDTDELLPGATATSRVYPFAPEIWRDVRVGTELEMTEGPRRTVGKAVVTRVVPAVVPVGQ